MTTKIVITGELPKEPIVIEGFPSKGFVSTIATRYLIEELDMKVVGHIICDKLRSFAIIHNSEIHYPIRIYAKGNILLIFSEIIIPIRQMHEISDAISKWLSEIKPKEVILLAGISGRFTEKEHEILGIATNKELRDKLRNADVIHVEEGMLSGISSDLILFCSDNKIPAMALIAETEYSPDPMAAVSMLKVMNKILGLDIDTERISREGKEIEEVFKRITEEVKRSKEHHEDMEDLSPPMYG
ncbi:MAG: PAC2 family protein [Candidatus Altiarchaeota archaeon]